MPLKVKEEQIKNVISRLYFSKYNCTHIEGNIDFTVTSDKVCMNDLFYQLEREYYLWAEAKATTKKDIKLLFVQLILTIGKSKELRNKIPPMFLGAFNNEMAAFIPYADIQEIFSQNDFNWNVTPSNDKTKEFKQLYNLIENTLAKKTYIFKYKDDDIALKKFIATNFKKNNGEIHQIEITQSNFVAIYTRWLSDVKNTIAIDWMEAKNQGILDSDFYLADVLSDKNQSVKNGLFVSLNGNHYEFNKKQSTLGMQVLQAGFNDNQQAHNNFWMKYKRPPKNQCQTYIISRKDLLVSQDIREIKGSYFTPQMWVQKSQEYLSDVLGENWQDEYYIWDCCAGTGNMENGLTNKYKIWASTLDQSDVDVMKDRAKNGANLLDSHIFQMDFLNDEFEEKCPKDLLEIIKTPEKRKKLIIYINPPYVEADNRQGSGRKGAALNNKIYAKYKDIYGKSIRELFVQFFVRIYNEIPECVLGEFSTLKILQAPNFSEFRNNFKARLQKSFIVPAKTFDNVKGEFPIGFFIWNTASKEIISTTKTNVFDEKGTFIGLKDINVYSSNFINDWDKTFKKSDKESIATIIGVGNDFQNQRTVRIEKANFKVPADNHHWQITTDNLINSCIYFSVRQCIKATWINDRDQFLYPTDEYETDKIFQSNCLIYTLFHSQNHIKSNDGINNWIPFEEKDIDAKDNFDSHFMTDYIKNNNIKFSKEAEIVLYMAKELWKYYNSHENSNPNASFYDIKEFFQGRNEKGRMNNNSSNEKYTELLWNLQQSIKKLENCIIPKIYEYGFLLS